MADIIVTGKNAAGTKTWVFENMAELREWTTEYNIRHLINNVNGRSIVFGGMTFTATTRQTNQGEKS